MRKVLFLLVCLTAPGVFAGDYWKESAPYWKGGAPLGVRKEKTEVGKRKEAKTPVVIRAKNSKFLDVLDLIAQKLGVKYVIRNRSPVYVQEERQEEATTETSGESAKTTTATEGEAAGEIVEGFPSLANIRVDFYYSGTSGNEAMRMLCESADVNCKRSPEGTWFISPYKVLIVDRGVFFDYRIQANMAVGSNPGAGVSGGTTGGVPAGGGGQSDSLSFGENYRDFVSNVLKPLMSEEGKVVFSPRGYMVIVDRPSKIREIKEVLYKEKAHEKPIKVTVRVLKIDLKDEYESGIDWSALLRGNFFGKIGVSLSSTSSVSGGNALNMTLNTADLESFIKILSNFGKVSVERSWEVLAKSGRPLLFNTFVYIPYRQQTASQGQTAVVTSEQFNYIEAGLKIKILPSRVENGVLEGGIYVQASDFLGYEVFETGDGVSKAPKFGGNVVAFPMHLQFGQSAVITGFKTDELASDTSGIPVLSRIPIIGHLFGYKSRKNNNSEFIVIVSVDDGESTYIDESFYF